jgi:cephalosporin hydroxylase
MSLWNIFLQNKDRKIHKWKHYFPAYESHFSRYVNRPLLFIEIGCGYGGSLQMWKKYFGPHAKIVGIDINPEAKAFEEDQIDIRIGDQNDPEFLKSIVAEFGSPDVVLDDASHFMGHTITSFKTLYPLLDTNGIYLVEDLHTSYWPEWGGGLNKSGTFIEMCKKLIDELNADHAKSQINPTAFTASILSMHFYDSMVVFQKGRNLIKHAPIIGS